MLDTPINPKQVAVALGVSEASIKRWCDQGLINASRTAGGHRRIIIADVVKFVREHGHAAVKPEVLGLPHAMAEKIAPDEAQAIALKALTTGDTSLFQRIVFDAFLGGERVASIADRLIAPVFEKIGSAWEHGSLEVYQEHRAVEICSRTLHLLGASISQPIAGAPSAIGGTIQGDRYSMPSTLAELVLRECGWRAQSIGCDQPASTIAAAVIAEKPRLVWVGFSHQREGSGFVEEYRAIYEAAQSCGAAVVVGGRALTDEYRRSMVYSMFCDTLKHLESFARTLWTPPLPSKAVADA